MTKRNILRRDDLIVAAIREGRVTSPQLAHDFGASRKDMARTLVRICEAGKIERAGYVKTAIQWRVGPALEAAQ